MRALPLLLGAVALVACESRLTAVATPPDAAPRQYGTAVDGLALHAKAPATAARGDLVAVELSVTIDRPEAVRLDRRPPAYFATLRLTPAAGGDEIVVRPVDPTAGMPDAPPPPGEDADHAVRSGASIGFVELPLASRWDLVLPGRYSGVIEYRHEEGVVHQNEVAGTWHGTLLSQPFELLVTAAPPRWLELRVPAGLLRGEVDGLLRLPVRNGFAVGLRTSTLSLGGGPDDGEVFGEALAGIAAGRAAADFTIFETSYLPEHLWHPGPGTGHYRVLWRHR